LPPGHRGVLLVPAAQVRNLHCPRLAASLRRAYRLGLGSGHVRRSLRVRGSFFARHPWSSPLIAPGRLVLTGWRAARGGWASAAEFLRLSPLLMCHWAWYVAGFALGSTRAGAARRHRDDPPGVAEA